ncbi:MAG: hypothetical protein ACLPYS_06470 [Vulcanimicrobiaceae bacterium]
MSATAKFYSGFFVFLAIVIGLSFYGGYRAGLQRERAALHEAHRLMPVSVPSGLRPATPVAAP